MFSPPTDNLYKFLAIFGLIIVMFSVYYPFQKLHELRFLAIEQKAEMELRKYQLGKIAEKLEFLTENMYTGGDFQKKMSAFDGLEKEMIGYKKAEVSIESNGIKINILMAEYNYYYVAGIIGCVLGLVLMVFGFVSWYKKTQKFLDYQSAQALAQAKEKDLIIPS